MKLLKSLKRQQLAIWLGLSLASLSVFIQFTPFEIVSYALNRADGLIYDLRLKAMISPRSKTLAEVIVVDIDERTMEEIGWPWPRAKLATLVENLADAGTVVIAFDVLFAEPERNPAKEVLAELQLRNQETEHFSPLITQMDGDLTFSESLQQTDVLLGFLLQPGEEVKRGQLPEHSVLTEQPVSDAFSTLNYDGYVTSLPLLHDASAGSGFINSSPDDDGFLRRSSLISRHNDKLYPSLSLEAARLYALADDITVNTQPIPDHINIEGIKIGNKLIPTDAEGRVLIPYRGPKRSFPYVSAMDILNGEFSHELFEGSVVFVGTSAVGLVDLRATPMGVQFPGVEVHANVFEGLLEPELLHYRPDFWQGIVLLYLVLVGIVLSIVMPFLGPVWMAIIGISTLTATILANFWLWSEVKMALPLGSSIFLVLTITSYNIARGFFLESQKRQQIKSIFNQYVPPAHIDKMLDNPDDISMEGERKELTVLFSDIRSFTTISEKLTANELKNLLNRYFNPITESIFNHHGTIDKYVGDMVMAFWGAPLDDDKHAQNALNSAFEMLRITDKLCAEFVEQGWPEIKVGVGLNTGDMNVGDMGSTFRRAYTVLGDSVNLGSRLEGLTKFYGVDCLVSESTMKQCPDNTFQFVDKVKVKGKKLAVSIFEPIDPLNLTPELTEQINKHHQAYEIYLSQDWLGAKSAYTKLQQEYPNVLLYQVYSERIEILKEQQLEEDWDGSFAHTSK